MSMGWAIPCCLRMQSRACACWCTKMMSWQRCPEVPTFEGLLRSRPAGKRTGRFDSGAATPSEAMFLNRALRRGPAAEVFEADAMHTEVVLKSLKFAQVAPAKTLAAKCAKADELAFLVGGQLVSEGETKLDRSVMMRASYVVQDFPDL